MRSETDAKEVGINGAVDVAGFTHLPDGFQRSSASSDQGGHWVRYEACNSNRKTCETGKEAGEEGGMK